MKNLYLFLAASMVMIAFFTVSYLVIEYKAAMALKAIGGKNIYLEE